MSLNSCVSITNVQNFVNIPLMEKKKNIANKTQLKSQVKKLNMSLQPLPVVVFVFYGSGNMLIM